MRRPLFDTLLTETIRVYRAGAAGDFRHGRYQEADPQEVVLRASVQPNTGRVMDQGPELERTRETITIFCAEELYTSTTSPLLRADEVEYDGEKYLVTAVERWKGLMPHTKATAELQAKG